MSINIWSKILFISLIFPISAFSQDALLLSREECETIFLQENILLIAERLEISKSEARVLQAKLWPNPRLEIEEVNFWTTKKHLDGGSTRRNQQFELSIEQLILTAGKHKKMVALEEVSVDKSKKYFEDLVRNLKIEFRNQLTHLQFLQFSKDIYQNQFNSIKQLTQSYQKQVEKGFIPKGEYIRLKALELEVAKEMNDVKKKTNEAQKELKMLMRLSPTIELGITPEGYLKNNVAIESLDLSTLSAKAKQYRPDYKISGLDKNYQSKLYAYEKAQRIPDITLKGAYDRGENFIGVGLSIDLPLFNRNQGNIRAAQIGMQHSKHLFEQKELSLENETVMAYQNLKDALHFFMQIEPDYESTLDKLLTSYTKNFKERNISLIEYIDFSDAYLKNKKIILEAGRELNEGVEELNYTVGVDVIN